MITKWYVIGDDREICRTGTLDSLHSFAQRERYCIWGLNAQQGNLVWAYNGKHFEAPTYPSAAATREIRGLTVEV